MGALLNLARGVPGKAESVSATSKSTVTDAQADRIPGWPSAKDDSEGARLLDATSEARRQRVLAMLVRQRRVRYTVETDDKTDPDAVILALAIRSAAQDGLIVTFELRVPWAKYDPVLLLDLIDKYSANVQ